MSGHSKWSEIKRQKGAVPEAVIPWPGGERDSIRVYTRGLEPIEELAVIDAIRARSRLTASLEVLTGALIEGLADYDVEVIAPVDDHADPLLQVASVVVWRRGSREARVLG